MLCGVEGDLIVMNSKFGKATRLLVLLFTVFLCGNAMAGFTAIAAAYDGEFNNVMEALEGKEITRVDTYNGVSFSIGTAHGYPVIVFETGIGLINAAMTTQLLFDKYPVDRLLFSGVSGSLDPDLHIGDVSVPAKWHYYETGARFTQDAKAPQGYKIAPFIQPEIDAIPGFKHYNNFFPYPAVVRNAGEPTPTSKGWFEADASLLGYTRQVAQQARLINGSGKPAKIAVGTIGTSGMAFNDDGDLAHFIRAYWGSSSVDMESTALAQVCWSNSIPFLVIRSMSDQVGNDNPNEFAEFRGVAEKNAASLLNLLLKSKLIK